jgi:hypothetical protein
MHERADMGGKTIVAALSEMEHGQEADVFVLMTFKEELRTKDGKPLYR